jgi:hypothetical protein
MLRHALALTLAASLAVLPTTTVAADEGGAGASPAWLPTGAVLRSATMRSASATSTPASWPGRRRRMWPDSTRSRTCRPAATSSSSRSGRGPSSAPARWSRWRDGESVDGVSVAPSAAALDAIAGGVGGGSFFRSTSGIVVMAAAAGGIGALAYNLKDDASPSK